MEEMECDGGDIRCEMLDAVASSDAHFISQQRGEPELTPTDKRDIAEKVLERAPGQFLFRFGSYLSSEHLKYFDSFLSDYEVSYWIGQLRETLDKNRSRKKVRNRRYKALQQMIGQGEYFSDRQMRAREPLLYEEMVGRYQTEEEKKTVDAYDESDCRLSSILLDQIDRDIEKKVKERQEDIESGQMEESDDDEEEEEESSKKESNADGINEAEKGAMKKEFEEIMYERFLGGKDKEFDYSNVDGNTEYDSLDQLTQDAEDQYFDEEDSDSSILSEDEFLDDKFCPPPPRMKKYLEDKSDFEENLRTLHIDRERVSSQPFASKDSPQPSTSSNSCWKTVSQPSTSRDDQQNVLSQLSESSISFWKTVSEPSADNGVCENTCSQPSASSSDRWKTVSQPSTSISHVSKEFPRPCTSSSFLQKGSQSSTSSNSEKWDMNREPSPSQTKYWGSLSEPSTSSSNSSYLKNTPQASTSNPMEVTEGEQSADGNR